MTHDRDEEAALPDLLARRYRRRRIAAPRGAERAAPELVARDVVLDREFDLVRVEFGPERLEERDAFVSRTRARTTLLAPAFVAIHDAGGWADDAFVLLERVGQEEPLEVALASADVPRSTKERWLQTLLAGALVLDRAGLALTERDWASAALDGYGVPRVRGLERASEVTVEAQAATVRALAALVRALVGATSSAGYRGSSEGLEALLEDAEAGRVSLRELASRWEQLVPPGDAEPLRPLLASIAPDAPSPSGERPALVLGVGLLVLAFGVLVALLALAR